MGDTLRILGLVSVDGQPDVEAQPSLTCPRQCHKEGLQRNRARNLNTLKHVNMLSRAEHPYSCFVLLAFPASSV
eukprot:15473793-Alexandrium_andersonii.AAC.1